MIKITKRKLELAVAEKIISQEQAQNLFDFLKALPSNSLSFDFPHVLYYMGGLITIAAMILFMNLGWDNFDGWGIFIISLTYAGVSFKLADNFDKKGHAVMVCIFATFIMALTSLAIYGLQQAMGWWVDESVYYEFPRYVNWYWIYLELGTLAVGVIIAWTYRYPFLQLPIAVTLWCFSLDIATMLAGGTPDIELRTVVSMYFGLTMTLFAFWIDFRASKPSDYAFWFYLFGVMLFWGEMMSQHSDSELEQFANFCVNLIFTGVGVVLVRGVFVVFGAIGSSIYLGHLTLVVFQDSWLSPIALTAIGLAIIYLGWLWQGNKMIIREPLNKTDIPRQNSHY